jgi:hypothetical protein
MQLGALGLKALKRIDDGREDEGFAQPLAAADEHAPVRQLRAAERFAHQPALADARLALHEDDGRRARSRIAQKLQFAVAPDEGRRRLSLRRAASSPTPAASRPYVRQSSLSRDEATR